MNCAVNPECTTTCSSQQHGSQITAAIIRGNEAQAIEYMKNLCRRCFTVADKTGKTALHTAVSCGKKEVVHWLVAHGASINKRDLENGYTPLHRALFFGQLHIAVSIIKAGANTGVRDYDYLTPLDHVNLDRPSFISFSHSLPTQLYVWGSNNNYNLGYVSQSARKTPDHLSALQREGLQIKDVAMNKFHSLFLTTKGCVYACGLGNGGRLGLPLKAPVIVPRLIKGFGNVKVTDVSIAVDHSLFLTETGQVWSCGSNKYHQLGLDLPVEEVYAPQPMTWHKSHKHVSITGIAAAKYHSVMWASKMLYTFGLNAGQIGHFKNPLERTIITPRKVTAFSVKEKEHITCVAASDGATVVCTSFGDVFVLSQYQLRKISSKMPVSKVACVGGWLDSTLNVEGLTEISGTDLTVVMLSGEGNNKLYIWTEHSSQMSCCLFNVKRELNVCDFCLSDHMLGIVTKEGEAFSASYNLSKDQKLARKFLDKTSGKHAKSWSKSYTMLDLTRIFGLHRTISIMCDPKGCNFAAIQNDPRSFLVDLPEISASTFKEDLKTLFLSANEMDSICDTIITCGEKNLFAHSYILACHSHYFKDIMLNNGNINKPKHSPDYRHLTLEIPKKFQIVLDVDPEMIQEILIFMYTGSCPILEEAKQALISDNDKSSQGNASDDQPLSGSFENKNLPKSKKRRRKLSDNLDGKLISESPLNALHKLSEKFRLKYLEQEIKNIIHLSRPFHGKDLEIRNNIGKLNYSRKSNQEFCDVTISSINGDKIGAHRCILSARLEYFSCMFGASWIESMDTSAVNLPLPTNIVTTILDYLYEDDSAKLEQCREAEFVCNVLAAADQFLMPRLREICELALVGLITLKNAVELLEFAATFRANQLKISVLEFICLNLSALLEDGSLLTIKDNEILVDLSTYYRKLISQVGCRTLNPYDQPPYEDELERLLQQSSQKVEDSDKCSEDVSLTKETSNCNKARGSSSKKKRQHRNSLGETRTRNSSTSSQVSLGSSSDCDSLKDLEQEFEALDFSDLEERSPVDSVKVVPQYSTDKLHPELSLQINGEIPLETMRLGELSLSEVSKIKNASQLADVSSHEGASPTLQQLNKIPAPQTASLKEKENQSSIHFMNEDSLPKSPLGEFPSLADSFNVAAKIPSASRNIKNRKTPQRHSKKKALGEVNAESPVEMHNPGKTSVNPAFKQSSPAWGKKEDSCGVASLADIMKAEENSVKLKIRQPTKPIAIQKEKTSQATTPIKRGWGISDPNPAQRIRSDSEGSGLGSLMATSPQGNSLTSPGHSFSEKDQVSSPQGCLAVSYFSEILKEEEIRTCKLRMQRLKTLGQIQIEDRAIEELFLFYGASECFDEKITVKRVKAEVSAANPVWSK